MNKSRLTEIMTSTNHSQSRATEIMNHGQENNLDHFHITIGHVINHDYTIEKVIAENTGEATIFNCRKADEQYVAKVYHRYKRPNKEILQSIKEINSPYVIKILDDGELNGRYYEILPFYEKGDLQNTLPNKDFVRGKFISSINEGLHSIHEKGIVHRDIKPNNIFYSNDGQAVVIGDFGISSQLNTGISYKLTSTSRTAGYAAPEVYDGIVSKEVDYYSLGITLLHLILGRDPFQGLNDQQIYIMTCVKKLEIPSFIDENMARLIKGLTLKDRTNRWGYEEINKWIKNEYVEINDGLKQKDSVVAYKFIDDNEYLQLEDLMIAFAQNWEEGKKHLYRGYLKRHMEDDFKNYGANLCSLVEDNMEETDQDLGLLKLIYGLNKNAPFCWKDRIFGDIISLVDGVLEIFPNIDNFYEEILRRGVISHYLEVKEYGKEVIDLVRQYEKEEDIEMAYFKLIYLLDPSKPLHWRGKVYTNLDDLADSIGKVYIFVKENKDVKALLLSGALEYFLQVNELNDISSKIESIRKKHDETDYNVRAIFNMIYALNPGAPFYFMGQTFKDTLELYEWLIKKDRYKRITGDVSYIINNHLLYDFLKLNKHNTLAENIEALFGVKYTYHVFFVFLDLLNSGSQYYFQGEILELDSIGKGILEIEACNGYQIPKAALRSIKILYSIDAYYKAKGNEVIFCKLQELRLESSDIIKVVMEDDSLGENLSNNVDINKTSARILKLYDEITDVLFKMLYIIRPSAPLWWKGNIFEGMDQIIDLAVIELQENQGNMIYQIVKGRYLSYYFKAKGLEDEEARLEEIENIGVNSYEVLSYLVFQYRASAPMIITGKPINGLLDLKELLTNSLDEHKDHKNEEFVQIREDIISLMSIGLLYKKLESSIGAIAKESTNIPYLIKDLSNMDKTKSKAAFWRLYFMLDGRDILYYKKKRFTSVDGFIDFVLEKNAEQIADIGVDNLDDPYFEEWLRTMGWKVV